MAKSNRAFWCSVLTGIVFSGWAYLTTQFHVISTSTPWQDDPYHGVVSFTEFLVPAMTGLMLARAALRRRGQPQSTFRVDQLARAGIVVAVLVALTVLTDILAVALRADRTLWTNTTPWLVASLLPLALLAAVSIALQRIALRALPTGHPDGDWLDDLTELLNRIAGVRVERQIGFIREHIILAAVLLSLAAGIVVNSLQAIGEGGESPLLFGTGVLVALGGFLAFSLICDAVLHIAIPRTRTAGPLRRATRIAVIAAALALPTAAVTRDSIWQLLGHHQPVSSVGIYTGITTITALLVGLLVFGSTIALTSRAAKT
ncbi:MAG TPA: hypothetical protein VHZ97_05875 [Pseudonocardiaceae bacterium]|nr:hypothetical protein [Pseudonocardiaceae bacterium]